MTLQPLHIRLTVKRGTIMEAQQRQQCTKHHTAGHVSNGIYSVENEPLNVQKQGKDENTQENARIKTVLLRNEGRKRKVRRPPYTCCVYSMYGVVYLSSFLSLFLSLFHCRLVLLYSVSSFLTCFVYLLQVSSLLEIKFCGNFWLSGMYTVCNLQYYK